MLVEGGDSGEVESAGWQCWLTAECAGAMATCGRLRYRTVAALTHPRKVQGRTTGQGTL